MRDRLPQEWGVGQDVLDPLPQLPGVLVGGCCLGPDDGQAVMKVTVGWPGGGAGRGHRGVQVTHGVFPSPDLAGEMGLPSGPG